MPTARHFCIEHGERSPALHVRPLRGVMSRRNLSHASTIAALALLQQGALPSPVQAHGSDPARALSIVAADAHGASVVRLNEGLAVRRPEGWRFVCPELWGEDAVVPAQSIPGGPVLIGASTGLFVMHDDGEVVRHADPGAAGRVIALGASSAGLFALRAQGAYEVLAVEAHSVRVLRSDTHPWADMSVTDSFLSLLRIEDGRLYELQLAPDGAVLLERDAPLPAGASNVQARVAGRTSYALLLSSTLSAELGRIEQGGWLSLARAGAIAGPLQTAQGQLLLALDAGLTRFDGEQLSAPAEAAGVTCLGRLGELDYACTADALRALESETLGAALFELAALLAPDLERVPEAARDACTLQWQRYGIDLLKLGITPRAPDAGAPRAADAAAAQPELDAGVSDTELEPEPLPEPLDATRAPLDPEPEPEPGDSQPHSESAGEPPAPPGMKATWDEVAGSAQRDLEASGGDCHCQPWRAPRENAGWSAWLALLGLGWLGRARRPRA
jgi:hypothetical protein